MEAVQNNVAVSKPGTRRARRLCNSESVPTLDLLEQASPPDANGVLDSFLREADFPLGKPRGQAGNTPFQLVRPSWVVTASCAATGGLISLKRIPAEKVALTAQAPSNSAISSVCAFNTHTHTHLVPQVSCPVLILQNK